MHNFMGFFFFLVEMSSVPYLSCFLLLFYYWGINPRIFQVPDEILSVFYGNNQWHVITPEFLC